MDPYDNNFEDEYDDYDQSDYYDEDEEDIYWDELAHNVVNMNLHSDLYDDVQDDYGYDPWDILDRVVLDVCNCEQEHVKFSLKIVDYERSSMPQPSIFHLHHICKMLLLLIDEARPFAGNWTMSAAEMIKSLEEVVTKIRNKLQKAAKKKLSSLLELPDVVIDSIYGFMLDTFTEDDWKFEAVPEEQNSTFMELFNQLEDKFKFLYLQLERKCCTTTPFSKVLDISSLQEAAEKFI